MRNTIIYYASDIDQVNSCAYSILKYLAVYNLKPPANHAIQIHTQYPAFLEAFGSFFDSFELKEPLPQPRDFELLKKAVGDLQGNIISLDAHTYPVKTLDPLFSSISGGSVYAIQASGNEMNGSIQSFTVLGFNTSFLPSSKDIIDGSTASEYFANYTSFKEFSDWLRYFFKRYQEESVPNQVKLIHAIDACQIQEQKRRYLQKPFYVRWMKKATGRGWNIEAFTGKV